MFISWKSANTEIGVSSWGTELVVKHSPAHNWLLPAFAPPSHWVFFSWGLLQLNPPRHQLLQFQAGICHCYITVWLNSAGFIWPQVNVILGVLSTAQWQEHGFFLWQRDLILNSGLALWGRQPLVIHFPSLYSCLFIHKMGCNNSHLLWSLMVGTQSEGIIKLSTHCHLFHMSLGLFFIALIYIKYHLACLFSSWLDNIFLTSNVSPLMAKHCFIYHCITALTMASGITGLQQKAFDEWPIYIKFSAQS